MKNFNCILFLLLGAPISVLAQSRDVDWIHGLGGDASSWQNVATTYSGQRQITGGTRFGYNTGNGIPSFANDLNAFTGGANTISIAHSLGGTAVRQLDIQNSSHWAGNITVGSPLSGAQIAVSARNGVAQQFINQGISELLRGPAAGSIGLTIISPGVGIFIRVAGILGSLFSDNIASAVVSKIIDKLSLTNTTASDLDPNGSYMNSVANQSTGSPKIQIWGREDNPILWRLAGTFSDETDQWGVDLANEAAGLYNTAADIEFVTSFVPPFILIHGYYNWRGHQWMAGANWLRDTANPAWQTVIGAGYATRQTIQVVEYDYSCGDQARLCNPDDTNCDDSQCLRWVNREVDVYVVDQSDGVVPARSARNDSRAWRGHIVEAPGINHMEMLRFDQIDPTISTIFNGNNTGGQVVFQIGQ